MEMFTGRLFRALFSILALGLVVALASADNLVAGHVTGHNTGSQAMAPPAPSSAGEKTTGAGGPGQRSGSAGSAQANLPAGPGQARSSVGVSVKNDTSPPLRSMKPIPPAALPREREVAEPGGSAGSAGEPRPP